MRNSIFIIAIILFSLNADEIRIRPPQSDNDVSHSYFQSLLQLALDKTADEFDTSTVICADIVMTQERALHELNRGVLIDVDWVGTNIQREEEYLPIRIPLIGGLLGYRIPAIRIEDTTIFNSIHSLDELKDLRCIQGSHWPDSDILESADLTVMRVPQFSSMYPMLQGNRVDYFPRGMNEVYSEVESVGETVTAYDKLIIAYKFPMYFFVSNENSALAERIEIGLLAAINDGSFLTHMQEHPATALLFPLTKYKTSLILHIDNPLLPPETPVDNELLWIKIE